MGFPSSLESEITKFKEVYFQAPIPKPFSVYYTDYCTMFKECKKLPHYIHVRNQVKVKTENSVK
jgi:hypothetical protein